MSPTEYLNPPQLMQQSRLVDRFQSVPVQYIPDPSPVGINQPFLQPPEKSFMFENKCIQLQPPGTTEHIDFFSVPQNQSTSMYAKNNNYSSPNRITQAYSTACIAEPLSPQRMSRFDRTQSMRFIVSDQEASKEIKRCLSNGKVQYQRSSESQSTSLNRKMLACNSKPWEEQLRSFDTPSSSTNALNNNPGLANKHRFFLKETQKLNTLLSDPSDRRIRAICDRFQCDLEVYSKVPKSGFLQYAIDITAPDRSSMFACARSLDFSLGWCLSHQIHPSQKFLVL